MSYTYDHLVEHVKTAFSDRHSSGESASYDGPLESLPISVCLTTKNNVETIDACLESVHAWTDEIVVVDSNSQDGTVERCEAYGANVYQHEFESFAQIKTQAMEHAENDWVFILDADEKVPETLRDEILSTFGTPGIVAFLIEKQEYMMGARTNQYHYKRPYLARKDVLYFQNEYIWERLSVEEAYEDRTETLSSRIDHYRFDRASEIESKMMQYSALEALQAVEGDGGESFLSFLVRGIAVAGDRLVISRGLLDGYRGFYVAFLEFYQMIAAYVKVRDIYRLQRRYPDRWREIWIREECRR
ncbi:glycosyltransferase family 2 protein [Natronolimnohabitans innermongolicus]|uniref:Family 2 glycosyl transferase n=1 Tax=Natronolimnohabitans innermongolicus JCM 12255 TaxID=1227499 RepID=L9XH37_9EURY|nr:glycosyltransferase family 2 protein [Natronolimnohabitans innermongolicus]ELY60736.1 family 2 glycosyl transferase [Natronolimnohabitans innermongolicus JCM 12255]